MKKFFITIACILAFFTVQANDTIPILNTVFHGINTLLNITRPVTVVQETPVVVNQPVVVTYPVVDTTLPGDRIVYGNGGVIYVVRSGVTYKYLPPPRPVYHPPPKIQHRPPKHFQPNGRHRKPHPAPRRR